MRDAGRSSNDSLRLTSAFEHTIRRSTKKDRTVYERNLANLIAHTKKGELYGEWNDYGRLLDY